MSSPSPGASATSPGPSTHANTDKIAAAPAAANPTSSTVSIPSRNHRTVAEKALDSESPKSWTAAAFTRLRATHETTDSPKNTAAKTVQNGHVASIPLPHARPAQKEGA